MPNFKTAFLVLSCLSTLYSTRGFSSSILSHLETPTITPGEEPWFTGPLLSPSAHTVPPHHGNVEPYLFFTTITGSYDANWGTTSTPNFYSLAQLTPVQVGLTHFMDCQITPQIFYQYTKGAHSTQFGDLPAAVSFQLLNEKAGSHIPAIKLSLRAAVPFGKFEHLNPSKLGTDGVGRGSWMPSVGVNFSRICQFPNSHFFAPRLALGYTVPGPVHISGLSVYGGALDTKGTVYPGNIFSCVLAFEYEITRHFTYAMDIYYQHTNKTRFSGNPGLLAQVASPSSEQFSLAPALEYNWNANIGLIAGVWFTVAGRNSAQFTSGVIALNIYI